MLYLWFKAQIFYFLAHITMTLKFLKSLAVSEFTLYALIGVINTAFGYFVYACLIFMGLHYAFSMLLATCIGVVFNFFTIGNVIFKNKNKRLFLKFVAGYGIIYIINVSTIDILTKIHLTTYLAGLAGIIVAAIFGFLINKYFVFSPSRS